MAPALLRIAGVKPRASLPILLLAASLLPSCVVDPLDDDAPEGEDGVGTTDLTAADGKADGTEVRARIDGLTVWVDPTMARTADGHWVLEGRASRNLEQVFSFVPDDAYATATVTGKRTFTVTFDGGSETNTMLSGLPIFVAVTPVSGEAATAAVWFAPRFASISGSTKIWLDAAIEPVWVGGDVVYRGGATTASGWTGLAATSAGGGAPAVTAADARHFTLDWRYDAMAQVADPAHDRLHVTAHDSAGRTASKTAGVQASVHALGLTRDDPYQVWARTCDPEVRACLVALAPGSVDAGACGGYREVQACGGLPPM